MTIPVDGATVANATGGLDSVSAVREASVPASENRGKGSATEAARVVARVTPDRSRLAGPGGYLDLQPEDTATIRLVMLYEGECLGAGAAKAAANFGYTRQGYYKVLQQFSAEGAAAFFRRPGPQSNYRRTDEVVRTVIAYRFQHPDSTSTEIVRHLLDRGLKVSKRSVERIVTEYGLQRRAYPKVRAGRVPACAEAHGKAHVGAAASARSPLAA